ncbi:MAG: tRNA (N(6)-L-threonylcarbamoyladenosine(37)-C(2))-methylthiotransferase MtaB [Chloroflexota bacterium]|nr:tRNA (N(6)-L-threonylcarbamoyladenosine(37)-C(2))-methylthiotransferase MtaB [Chloroflexota bacterium]
MKIFLDVIGCRLNQSEVETIANNFRALGHEIVPEASLADLAIVNTCAVTVKAAADSRKQLRRAAREGAARVVATGCWATLHPDDAVALPGVTDVVLNEGKDELVSDLLSLSADEVAELVLLREPLPGERARTRAFIKVQEGCDNHCTYCLTRLARGKSHSRTLSAIRKDVRAALAGDAKEVVLTGVQLGAWGWDLTNPRKLSDLITDILDLDGVRRVRLSSIEPWDIDLEMLALWSDDRLCPHLHLPLQSGHDRVLQKMGRPITTETYAALVDRVRQAVPDLALTTDVIAGFPGETEEEFQATKAFISRMGFAGGHVFTYSPRPGTAAVRMKGRVTPQVAKARNAELRKVFAESGRAYRQEFIGRKMSVLWENSEQEGDEGWRLSGLTGNYMRVHARAEQDLWNQISEVRLTSQRAKRPVLDGEIVR